MTAKRPPKNLNFLEDTNEQDDENVVHGRWSRSEDRLLYEKVVSFLGQRDMSLDEYREFIASDRETPRKYRGMFKYVHQFLPHRKLKSIMARADRLFHPYRNQGAWSQSDTEKLYRLIEKYGNQWHIICKYLGRYRTDCHDKIKREREKHSDWVKSKVFTPEEDRKLIKAIDKHSPNWRVDGKIAWIPIGLVMKRPVTRCRNAWYTRVHAQALGYEPDPSKWPRRDYRKLVSLIRLSGAKYQDEIPWDQLRFDRSTVIMRGVLKHLVEKYSLQDLPYRRQIKALCKEFGIRDDSNDQGTTFPSSTLITPQQVKPIEDSEHDDGDVLDEEESSSKKEKKKRKKHKKHRKRSHDDTNGDADDDTTPRKKQKKSKKHKNKH